ncbi:MAG: hypothetical protein CM15mP120_21910 [Pseudomonadota bacterium]|nr:MAG: hypothetical protein CM15mP120_21910 [Pseudomonadota bacterium]
MKKAPAEHEVVIDTLSDEGLGGATLNDRPLWVRNALPGERVQARYSQTPPWSAICGWNAHSRLKPTSCWISLSVFPALWRL